MKNPKKLDNILHFLISATQTLQFIKSTEEPLQLRQICHRKTDAINNVDTFCHFQIDGNSNRIHCQCIIEV